jgi:hypothetical protein
LGILSWGVVLFGVTAGTSQLIGAAASGKVEGVGSWLLLAGGFVALAAALWSSVRISWARLEISPQQVVIRNIWRTYRLERADIRGLSIGLTPWLSKVGVIETRSGQRIRPWALLLGYPDERSGSQLRAVLLPVAEELGLDRVD